MSQQEEIGTLVVVVLKAQHLHQPSFYKQDPYARATFSGLKKRTKVAPKGGQHPVWDDELRFPVLADVGKDKANRILEIACYKDEQRGEDVLLGKGAVDIEETLKIGEFDDWVPLETSAGARGEVYLEMTFYANSPPPLMRRPSKLNPSDLLRPAQGKQSIPKTSPIASVYTGQSPITTERKPAPANGSQIPMSLIPARGGKSQASQQVPLNGGASLAATTLKHKDASLPPLPGDDPLDVVSGRNPRLPTALHPGGRSGPRPTLPQNQSQVTSMGRPPPEILPEQLRRRTLSDTLALHAPSAFPQQPYSSTTTALTVAGIGATPSILVEEHFGPLRFPTPLTSPQGTHPSMQPHSQAFVPPPVQSYSQTLSPFQPPMPPQSPYIPPGQTQQHYDSSPPESPLPSRYQQYTQYPSRPMTSQPLPPTQTYPQHHIAQPQQQTLSQYPPQQLPNSPQLQPYGLSSQQQQYLSQPQHLPYTQTPHPPQVPQPYQQQQHNYAVPALGNQCTIASQQPSYSQPQPQPSIPVPPPPPPIRLQSQTSNTNTETPHQSRSYFSPPPPPPPLLHSQGKNEPSVLPSVAQPPQVPIPPPPLSQGLISPSASPRQSVSPVVSLPQPSATPPPSQGASGTALAASTEVTGQSRVEERPNEDDPIVIAEMTAGVQETREPLGVNQTTDVQNKDVIVEEQGQLNVLKDVENQGVQVEGDSAQRMEEGSEEGLRGLEETRRREAEEERKRQEQKEREKQDEEARKERERRWEEERRREEEARKEEERGKREEELRRREEELRKKEEELKRREEEERRRRQEEEEHKRRVEEEHKRLEEERRKRAEERRRQEEERVRHEREEVERRQKEAEEAKARRRWQEELTRIKARAEQEAADAAFARAQMEAEEAERQRQEEEDLVLVRQAQEEEEREERLAQERRRQEEADREVARREQAHEQELERRRQEERRKKMEKADRELARKLEIELNLSI